MNKPIYLDYAATTPVDPKVREKMLECLGTTTSFGNPASRSHTFGRAAEQAVANARAQVAELLHAKPQEIIWTSGATESDNLAIKGIAYGHADRGKHIITSALEHKAVLDSCHYLTTQGFEVTYLRPGRDGIITPAMVKTALRDDTILLSLMHVNNELGTITDIAAMGVIAHARDVIFHVDAAQSAARLPIDVRSIDVDLMSLSAHKMYGPKGIGALYIRHNPRVTLQSQMHGGGHEGGFRSGTIPTHQVVGMGTAAELVQKRMATDTIHLATLTQPLLEKFATLENVSITGDRSRCVAGIINVCFGGVASESMMLSLEDVAIASGAACTWESVEPSYVLTAIGMDADTAYSALRFSPGRFTTKQEIDYVLQKITHSLDELRALSSNDVAH